MSDMVLAGGQVVTEHGVERADIAVTGGRICAIGNDLHGAETIDCRGKLILPGGVDHHCHIEQKPSKNGANAETFETGTASAALGGTTTVICFIVQEAGRPLMETLSGYRKRAEAALIDYAFHIIINDPRPDILDELSLVVEAGIRSIKIFMTYEGLRLTDAQILPVLERARMLGCLVAVHAENHDIVLREVARLAASAPFSGLSHQRSRPIAAEAEAVERVIALSEITDQPIHIFHVTCERAADRIAAAQRRGLNVHAETCTHYLTLTNELLDAPIPEAARFMCAPPLRNTPEREALWNRIKDKTIDTVSSDHSPYRFDDPLGKLKDGPDTPFHRAASGMPGLATRLPVLFEAGVASGRIDLVEFAKLTATNQAKLYGLYPRKGVIAVGSDADIAVWDLARPTTITAAMLRSGAGYTPFEGMRVRAWPVLVLSRGRIVSRDGMPGSDRQSGGRYIGRAAYDIPHPRERFHQPIQAA